MAYIRYKVRYTFERILPSTDPDPANQVEEYTVETWDFDTVVRGPLYRSRRQNPRLLRYPDEPDPADDQTLGEVWGECIGVPPATTRRAYLHDGSGRITTADTPGGCATPLLLEELTPQDPAPGQSTGSVRVRASGGTGQLLIEIPGALALTPLPAAGLLVPGLAPGTYTLQLSDSATPPATRSQAFTVRPAVIGGCTDRAAVNFDPDARYEDGSCQYARPERAPVFRVPRLNPVRFVLPQSDELAQTLDNTLFCEQSRPGQQIRPRWQQPVQPGDALALQVHTNLEAVQLEVYALPAGTLERTLSLTEVQRHTGAGAPLPVLLEAGPDGLTALRSVDPTAAPLPASLRRAAWLTLDGAATGAYRIVQVSFNAAGQQVLLLSRPWVEPAVGAVSAQWLLDSIDFNVWEGTAFLNNLPAGAYELRLRGTDAVEADIVAVSEPLLLAATHENTLTVEYTNQDNAYGMVWSTGIQPRLRLPGTFFRRKPAGDVALHRSSSGAATVLSSTARRQIILETAALPDWLHETLFLVFRLDSLRVNSVACLAPDAYEATELRQFPLSAGTVTLELLGTAGFGVGNSTDNGTGLPGSDDTLLELQTGGFLKLH